VDNSLLVLDNWEVLGDIQDRLEYMRFILDGRQNSLSFARYWKVLDEEDVIRWQDNEYQRHDRGLILFESGPYYQGLNPMAHKVRVIQKKHEMILLNIYFI
jgi:hypothetical protein